ncbi:hypothetical protein CMI47_05000 [Candidatus Pacearchaeota archaeon]|nr:hypothetical protein [Candidatus Pacearchaeota archaeon]|tara:strand:- start:2993 stop:3244 length:252 start_codon:yes stop_codon:yes gene_type:complete
MIGQLVELSAFGRKLLCCQHLKGYVGLVVDVTNSDEDHGGTQYWIEWVGMTPEDAYPQRWRGANHPSLTNGTWNRRDFKLVKK